MTPEGIESRSELVNGTGGVDDIGLQQEIAFQKISAVGNDKNR